MIFMSKPVCRTVGRNGSLYMWPMLGRSCQPVVSYLFECKDGSQLCQSLEADCSTSDCTGVPEPPRRVGSAFGRSSCHASADSPFRTPHCGTIYTAPPHCKRPSAPSATTTHFLHAHIPLQPCRFSLRLSLARPSPLRLSLPTLSTTSRPRSRTRKGKWRLLPASVPYRTDSRR